MNWVGSNWVEEEIANSVYIGKLGKLHVWDEIWNGI